MNHFFADVLTGKEHCCAALIKAVSRGNASLVGVSLAEERKETRG